MKRARNQLKKDIVMIFIAVIMIVAVFFWNQGIIASRKANVRYHIDTIAQYKIKDAVNDYIEESSEWADLFIDQNGQFNQKFFEKSYHKPAVLRINLLHEQQYHTVYQTQNTHLKEPIQLTFSQQEDMRKSNQAMLFGPIENICVIYNPLYYYNTSNEKVFWGFVCFELRFPEMLEMVNHENQMYDYTLTSNHHVILASSKKQLQDPVSTTIPLANTTWVMKASWKGGWMNTLEYGFEALIVALILFLIYYFMHVYGKIHENEKATAAIINNSNDALSIVVADGEEVVICNKGFKHLLQVHIPLTNGISFGDYYQNCPLSFHEIIENGLSIIDINNQSKIVIRSTMTSWKGKKAYILRAKEYDPDYFDSLTLLPNQYYFEKEAPSRITTMTNGCVAYFDVYQMKLYNIENGFAAGDLLLKHAAFVIQEIFPQDLLARFTNDRFCLLTTTQDIIMKIKKVNEAMNQFSGLSKANFKCGIYLITSSDTLTIAQMCDRAKMAVDSIHDDQDTEFRFYDQKLQQDILTEKYITDHIEEAIKEKEIKLYYQPLVNTKTKKLIGFEVLTRWQSKELGFLNPSSYIPILEKNHKITKLNCYVIHELCRRYQEISTSLFPVVPVSFNLSLLDLQMADMCHYLIEETKQYQVPHDYFHIEFTESIFFKDKEKMLFEIQRFHDAGFDVWMDDFGSGYSTLNLLKDFDFDLIKIDMEFLSSNTNKSKEILQSLIDLIRKIDEKSLVEGCETEEQVQLLTGLGCDYIQGYYYGKPLPLNEALANALEKHLIEK